MTVRGLTTLRTWTRGSYRPNGELIATFLPAQDPTVTLSLARAVDDQGRSVRFGHESRPGSGRYEAALEMPRGATHVQLTFAAHASHLAEFIVRPRWTLPPPAPAGVEANRHTP